MAAKQPTTTISTIAIKAGDHTRIILAVLKVKFNFWFFKI